MDCTSFLAKLEGVRETGEDEWQARCPAHDDQRASLSVACETDGTLLVKCHAYCATPDVMATLGLKMSDLFPTHKSNGKKRIVATYDYADEDGTLSRQSVRYEPKDFRQRRPDGKGGWVWNTKDCANPPYRLPELLAADRAQTVFVPEGEKDCNRLAALGLVATCNIGGAGKWRDEHAECLHGRNVVILPDNDVPGSKHALQVAKSLQGIAAGVKIVRLPGLPDKGDISDWIDTGGTIGQLLSLVDETLEWEPTFRKSKGPKRRDDDEKKQSTADKLVELALKQYRIGRTETDEAFAVEIDGPNIAVMFRGSRDALRSALARGYRQLYERTPNATALADALCALQGEAYAVEPEPVYLRVAEQGNDIILDLGDATGRVVIIGPGDWSIAERSPVLFRRTAATGVLPEPQRGGSLDELRGLLNVSDETWPLALGWEVAALVPNSPHPILLLGGQQGSGKTSVARKLVGLVDPSPAALRSSPRDVETWCITAAGSYVVGIDNVSYLAEWLQDSLCKAVTGDGWLRRKLYTDGELAVLSFRRVILLTSIDPGALRGDLGDRVLLVDLEPIDEINRRAERDIEGQYDEARPQILGALLDLLARVLAELPNVHLDRLPRMADFGRLLAAMDRVLCDGDDQCDQRSLDIYLGQRERIAETVVESDQVALAIESLLDEVSEWEGTATELLVKITPEKPPRDWPRTPQSLGGRLKRLTPALEQTGIVVEHLPRSGRRKVLSITTRKATQKVVTPVTSSQTLGNPLVFDDDPVTSGDQRDQGPDSLVTPENGVFPEENGSCDQSDQCDEQLHPLSSWGEV